MSFVLKTEMRMIFNGLFERHCKTTSGNEYASLVADGVEAGDVDSYIDSGSFIFNALLSGSIYGGLPSNKITAIAGESATGKTFFVMGMCKTFWIVTQTLVLFTLSQKVQSQNKW